MESLGTGSPGVWSSLETATVKLARGAGVSLMGSVVGGGLHVLVQITIARLLSLEAFGLYSIGWAILRILSTLSQLGLDYGVIRYASIYRGIGKSKLKGVLLQSLGFPLLAAVLAGSTLYWGAPWLARTVFQKIQVEEVLKGFAVGVPLLAGLMVAAMATRASQSMHYAVYAKDLAQPLINLVLVIIFYLFGWQLLGAVYAGVLSCGIGLFIGIYYVNRLFPEMLSRELKPTFLTKELVSFSLPLLFAGFLSMLIMWTDTLMLGYFRPADEVGIYQAASQISMVFVLILGAFNSILAPMIAELYHQGDLKTLQLLFKISTKWALYLSLPFFLVISFAASDVMVVVFGRPYVSGAVPLLILASAQLFNVGTGPVGYVLIMAGYQKLWLVNTTTAAVINVILNLTLIPKMGIVGAAIATAFSVMTLFLSGLIEARVILKVSPYNRGYIKGIVAACITIIVLVILGQVQSLTSPTLRLLLLGSISVSGFILLLIALGIEPEEKSVIRTARRIG